MLVSLHKYISASLQNIEGLRSKSGISNAAKVQLVDILNFVGQEAKPKILCRYVYEIKDVCTYILREKTNFHKFLSTKFKI